MSHRALQILSSEPKLRATSRIVKNNKLGLQENITEDRKPNRSIALNAPKARRTSSRKRRVIHIITRHNSAVSLDLERDIRESSAAGEDVAAVSLAVGGAGNLGVVCCYDVVGQEEERRSSVGNGRDTFGNGGAGADCVACASEAPESLRVVDGCVGDASGVGGVVDVAEVVAAWLALFEIGGEEWGAEESGGVVEKGLLLVWGYGVDGGEGETEESVALVLSE